MLPRMQCGDCVAADVTSLEEIQGNSMQVLEVQDCTQVPSYLAEA